MNQYAIRKNFTASFSDTTKTIRGKLAFKTTQTHWINTQAPVIIPISIYSAFHDDVNGDLKMNALTSIVRGHVKNKVTILFTEKAHLEVESLKWRSQKKAFDSCMKQALSLKRRYSAYFENCNVVFWDSYICQNPNYNSVKESLKKQTDPAFRNQLLEDALNTYTFERSLEYPNKNLFIEKTTLDILEQCAAWMVLANKGYKFWFYPGRSYTSINYVNQFLVPKDKQISWIDVFLSIEKKTISYAA